MTDYDATTQCGPADVVKDPSDITNLRFEWAKELDGSTISTSDVLLPDGLTEVSDTASGSVRIIRVSGGDEGGIYRVTNRIVLANGLQMDKTQRVLVRER